MTTDELRWCFCPPPASAPRLPEWLRSAAMARDGTVFLPAAISGNESHSLISALWDGVTMIEADGRVYLPARWIAAEYPAMALDCNAIAARVREQLGFTESPR